MLERSIRFASMPMHVEVKAAQSCSLWRASAHLEFCGLTEQ
jgi:hypothetical protein